MEPWQHRFENHMGDAEIMMAEGAYQNAFACFKVALAEIPQPQDEHHESTRAIIGIGDCYYFLGQYENAEEPLRDVLLLPDGPGNPYIRLRRGQVFYHLGDEKAASVEWTCAFLNGGREIFEGETDCKEKFEEVIAGLGAVD